MVSQQGMGSPAGWWWDKDKKFFHEDHKEGWTCVSGSGKNSITIITSLKCSISELFNNPQQDGEREPKLAVSDLDLDPKPSTRPWCALPSC